MIYAFFRKLGAISRNKDTFGSSRSICLTLTLSGGGEDPNRLIVAACLDRHDGQIAIPRDCFRRRGIGLDRVGFQGGHIARLDEHDDLGNRIFRCPPASIKRSNDRIIDLLKQFRKLLSGIFGGRVAYYRQSLQRRYRYRLVVGKASLKYQSILKSRDSRFPVRLRQYCRRILASRFLEVRQAGIPCVVPGAGTVICNTRKDKAGAGRPRCFIQLVHPASGKLSRSIWRWLKGKAGRRCERQEPLSSRAIPGRLSMKDRYLLVKTRRLH